MRFAKLHKNSAENQWPEVYGSDEPKSVGLSFNQWFLGSKRILSDFEPPGKHLILHNNLYSKSIPG